MKYKKVLLAITLLSFSLQIIPFPGYAAEEYKTLEEFLNEYDPTVEYETGSRLLPKEGDDIERILDLIFEHFPDLTEEQMAQVIKECGRDISCWEAMASEYNFQNEGEQGRTFKGGALRGVWEGIKKGAGFVGGLVGDFRGTLREEGVSGIIGRVGDSIKGFAGKVGGGVKSFWRITWGEINGVFDGIWKEVGRVFGVVKEKAARFLGRDDRTSREDKMKKLEERFGIPIEDGTAKWGVEELDWLEDVLETVPSEFYDSKNLSQIERDKGDFPCGDYNPGSEVIRIYDISHYCIDDSYYLRSWQKHSLVFVGNVHLEKTRFVKRLRSGLRRLSFETTVTHELTHAYVNDKEDTVRDFANISWEEREVVAIKYKDGEKMDEGTPTKWVRRSNSERGSSSYADKTYTIEEGENDELIQYSNPIGRPWEDLAEFSAYYVYALRNLKKTSPKKYDFVKDEIFDGREFSK